MKKSFEELIERANDIKVWLDVCNYEVYYHDDCSYVDFRVMSVSNLPSLLSLAGFCRLKIFADEHLLKVRLYERDDTEIDDV